MIEHRAWGASGALVPWIGQGTWNMERDDRNQAIEALRVGLDLGLTHIDTAELYGSGVVEEIVAEAIAGRRDEVFLVSKVWPSNATKTGTREACERSLRRLRTDRLDGYLLHWPGPHPLADTLQTFEALMQEGKIRSYGVSNFDAADLAEAEAIVGPGKIACNQVLYHLRERGIEHRVEPYCAQHRIALVGYSPFGTGNFPLNDPTLERIANAHGATPQQVALAFLARAPHAFAIPKASNPAHVRANAAAANLVLDPDELRAIDEAFPRGKPPRTLPTA